SFAVLLGNGDGTYQTATTYSTGLAMHTARASDFNRDGLLDLLVAGSSQIEVWAGTGDGRFTLAYTAATGANMYAVVGDFNGDGATDILNSHPSGGLGVWLNQTAANPHLSISVPASATVGTPFEVTVTALDSGNQTANDFIGTVHFVSSDRFAGLPANYTF